MKPSRFTYHRPSSVAEAVATLHAHDGAARVLAGGQSLAPMLNMRLWRPEALVDINDIDDLDSVDVDGEKTVLGCTGRYSTVERSALLAERLALLVEVGPHRRPSGPQPGHNRRRTCARRPDRGGAPRLHGARTPNMVVRPGQASGDPVRPAL